MSSQSEFRLSMASDMYKLAAYIADTKDGRVGNGFTDEAFQEAINDIDRKGGTNAVGRGDGKLSLRDASNMVIALANTYGDYANVTQEASVHLRVMNNPAIGDTIVRERDVKFVDDIRDNVRTNDYKNMHIDVNVTTSMAQVIYAIADSRNGHMNDDVSNAAIAAARDKIDAMDGKRDGRLSIRNAQAAWSTALSQMTSRRTRAEDASIQYTNSVSGDLGTLSNGKARSKDLMIDAAFTK